MGTPIQEPAFDPQLFDIRHVIDLGLASRSSILGDQGAKAWRASSLGYCMRRQFFERAGVPKIARDDGNRTLWLGDIIHRAVQNMIVNAGLMLVEEKTLVDDELEVSGHIDLIWGGIVQSVDYQNLVERYGIHWADFILNYRAELVRSYSRDAIFPVTMTEFKSANQYSAEKAYADGASFHHKLQAGCYRALVEAHASEFPESVSRYGGLDRYQIVMLAKSDLKMPVFDIHATDANRAIERLLMLKELWHEQRIPPCTCGHDISWERRYCAYRHPDDAGKKEPRCCMPELIEQADPSFWEKVYDSRSEEVSREEDEAEVLPKD